MFFSVGFVRLQLSIVWSIVIQHSTRSQHASRVVNKKSQTETDLFFYHHCISHELEMCRLISAMEHAKKLVRKEKAVKSVQNDANNEQNHSTFYS